VKDTENRHQPLGPRKFAPNPFSFKSYPLNVSKFLYDKHKRFLVIAHTAENEHHLRDELSFVADIVGLAIVNEGD
jgi:hypothetical protein